MFSETLANDLSLSKETPNGNDTWLTLGISKDGTVRLWFNDVEGLWKAQPRNNCLRWKIVTLLNSAKPMIWFLTIKAKKDQEEQKVKPELLDYLDNLSISTDY